MLRERKRKGNSEKERRRQKAAEERKNTASRNQEEKKQLEKKSLCRSGERGRMRRKMKTAKAKFKWGKKKMKDSNCSRGRREEIMGELGS